jgi:arylsulfatase A-like enzyme
MAEGRTFAERELQAEIDAYDGGIAFEDQELGRLLDALEQRGLLDNTLVIVTSDHGEEFGEHAVFTHGNSLYDPSLHVPLVFGGGPALPRALRVPAWVSTRDIASTIADLAGVSADPPLGGASLARFWDGSDWRPDTLVAAVSYAPGHPDRYPVSRGDMDAVLIAPYKYIHSGDGSEELYDLTADPGERLNLAGSAAWRSVVARLRAYLEGVTGED